MECCGKAAAFVQRSSLAIKGRYRTVWWCANNLFNETLRDVALRAIGLTLFSAPFRRVEFDYFTLGLFWGSVWWRRKPPTERLGGCGKFESVQDISLTRRKSRGADDSPPLVFLNDDRVALEGFQ